MALRPIQPISLTRAGTRQIQPFEPDQQQIEQERARIESEGDENLFFRVLRAPKRLLFGESIQGGLEGFGREGIGEGARKAFVNNPLFQVLEGVSNVTESLFGLDVAEGAGDALEFLGLKEEGSVGLVEDTDFEDVREAFGYEGFDNAIADGATLLLGELVTSPLELFFTPFGLTKAGYAAKALKGTPRALKAAEAAGEVARLAGKSDQEIAAIMKIAGGEIPADLGKATEAGLRTMFNFKVPFTDAGFSYPMPKNLDLYSARVLQGTADWLNVNPATAGIMRMFNSSQVKEADAGIRATTGVAEESGKLAANEYTATMLSKLGEAIGQAPEVALSNPDFNKIIAQMTELGVTGMDSKADIARIFSEGRAFLPARKAREEVLTELATGGVKLDDGTTAFRIDDDAAIGFSATVDGKAGRFVDEADHPGRLIDEAIGNNEDLTTAVSAWQQAFPNAQVPTKALDGVVDANIFRKGVDVPDPDQFKPQFSDPAIDAAVPGASPADIAIRADIALEQQGVLSKTVQDVRTRVLPDILDDIEKIDTDGKLLAGMQEFSESMQKLGQEMAEKDLADGIINGAVEMYLPRDLTPEVRDLIDGQWSKIGAPRSLDELTIVEANAYAAEYGLKLTKERSVKDLVAKEGDGAFFNLMAKIFPDSFVQNLKTVAKGGDPGALEMATFFDTNPVRTWYQRVEKAAKTRNSRAFQGKALEKNSPMVLRETTYAEVLTDLEGTVKAQKEGNTFLVPDSKGGGRFVEINALDNSKVKAEAFGLQESAKAKIAGGFVEQVFKTKLADPKANIDVLVSEISDTVKFRDLNVRHRKAARTDLRTRKVKGQNIVDDPDAIATNTKRTQSKQDAIADLDQQVRALDDEIKLVDDEIKSATQSAPEKPASTFRPDTPGVRKSSGNRRAVFQIQNDIKNAEDALKEFKFQNRNRMENRNVLKEIKQREKGAEKLKKEAVDSLLHQVDASGNLLYPDEIARRKNAPKTSSAEPAQFDTSSLESKKAELVARKATAEAARKTAEKQPVSLLKTRKTIGNESQEEFAGRAAKAQAGQDARLRTLEEDFAQMQSGPFKDTSLAKIIEEQIDTLKSWDTVGHSGMDAIDRRALETGNGAEALKAQRLKTSGRLTGHKDEVKILKQKLKEHEQLGLPKGSQNYADLQARLKRMEQSVEQLKVNERALIDMGKDQRAYLKPLKEKADANRKRIFAELEEKERVLRQGASDWIDGMRSNLSEFRKTVGETEADAKLRKSLIKTATGTAKADIQNSTKAFNDLFEAHLLQKEHGSIPLENLGKMDQLAVDTMLKEAGGSQRVVMVDTQSYNEILHPVTGLLARKNKPDFLAKHLTWFDNLTNVWKAWTTLPAFAVATRTRDQVTNFILQVQGGMKPWNLVSDTGSLRFNKALGKSIKTGNFDHLRNAPVGARISEATGAKDGYELFEYLYARDIISPNMIKQQTLIEAGTRYIDTSKALPFADVNNVKTAMQAVGQRLGTRNSIIQKGTRMAEFLDDQIKVQSWMSHVIDGKNGDEAAGIVRKWIYDPRRVDSSTFEKTVLKRFIPFYSYARFAIKAQVEAYFTKPGTVAFWDKLSTSAQSLTGLSEVEQELVLPDFIKDNFGVPTSVENGVIKLRLFGNNFPLSEAGRVANAIQDTFSGDTEKGISSELGARMNPLIRLPIEQAINESFFSQRPIQRFEGEQVEYLGTTMSASMRHNLMSIRWLNEIDRVGVLGRNGFRAIMAGQDTADDRGRDLADRTFDSAFSPLGALGRAQPRIIADDAGRAIRRENRELSDAKAEITRAMAREERTGVSEQENLKVLQGQIAKRVANIRIINEAAERNQQ